VEVPPVEAYEELLSRLRKTPGYDRLVKQLRMLEALRTDERPVVVVSVSSVGAGGDHAELL
jgi:hypothetical protein